MSDDRRKNARLQGRFSDEHKPRKEKSKRTSDPTHKDNSSNTSSSEGKSSDTKSLQVAEGYNITYDQHASVTFQQFEEKVKPVAISEPGEHTLSITENGKSRVIFEPDFISETDADELFTILRSSTQWYDKNIIIHGQEVPQPRLVAWYGPLSYAYSGAILDKAEMPDTVLKIKKRVEEYLKTRDIDVNLNSVLLNLYRDGKDSVAWHSDDELSMGIHPTIASVSLGATRKFQMKIKANLRDKAEDLKSTEYSMNLTNGSLVIMDGCMQKDWKHQVPKEYHDRGPRINLTFRTVYAIDKMPSQVPFNEIENNLNILTHSKKTESKGIFDESNFPPLVSDSKTEIKVENTLVETPSSPDQNHPGNNVWDTNSRVKLGKAHPETEDQNFDSAFKAENGNTFATADVAVCDTQDAVGTLTINAYVAECQTADDEGSVDSKCDMSYTEDFSEDSASAEDYTQRQRVKSELNADAPLFIPKCHSLSEEPTSLSKVIYSECTLTKLAELFIRHKVPPSEFEEYSSVLAEKIRESDKLFLERDHYELDVLLQINDGSQTEKNQEIILARLCSMIKNANYRVNQNWKSYQGYYGSQQSSRNACRDGIRPPRGSRYIKSGASSSYRRREYKD